MNNEIELFNLLNNRRIERTASDNRIESRLQQFELGNTPTEWAVSPIDIQLENNSNARDRRMVIDTSTITNHPHWHTAQLETHFGGLVESSHIRPIWKESIESYLESSRDSYRHFRDNTEYTNDWVRFARDIDVSDYLSLELDRLKGKYLNRKQDSSQMILATEKKPDSPNLPTL